MTFRQLLAQGRIEGPGSTSQAYRPRLAVEANRYVWPVKASTASATSGMPFVFKPKS